MYSYVRFNKTTATSRASQKYKRNLHLVRRLIFYFLFIYWDDENKWKEMENQFKNLINWNMKHLWINFSSMVGCCFFFETTNDEESPRNWMLLRVKTFLLFYNHIFNWKIKYIKNLSHQMMYRVGKGTVRWMQDELTNVPRYRN